MSWPIVVSACSKRFLPSDNKQIQLNWEKCYRTDLQSYKTKLTQLICKALKTHKTICCSQFLSWGALPPRSLSPAGEAQNLKWLWYVWFNGTVCSFVSLKLNQLAKIDSFFTPLPCSHYSLPLGIIFHLDGYARARNSSYSYLLLPEEKKNI